MSKLAITYCCKICGSKYQMGEGKYEGKYIQL